MLNQNAFSFLNQYIEVSCEIFEKLKLYETLLRKWQAKINLVGPDTLSDVWNRHFLDSLQLLPLLKDHSGLLIDVGSGAGFPGMVLAICGYSPICLIECDNKKITFLKEVSRLTKSNITYHSDRMEDYSEMPSIIVSRACSPLSNLLSLCEKNVSRGTHCLFHKGKNYATEIEEAKKCWQFDTKITPSITDPLGVILSISNIERVYDK